MYYLGKLIAAAKPLAAWATDALGLTAKNTIVSQAERTDELVKLFDKGSSADSIALNGKPYAEIPYQKGSTEVMSNANGTTKVMDTTALNDTALQKEVFDYAKQLAGGKEITPVTRNGQPLEGRWTATLDDGTKINVRSVSSSNAGRWTVDIQKSPAMQNVGNSPKNQYEIKFK